MAWNTTDTIMIALIQLDLIITFIYFYMREHKEWLAWWDLPLFTSFFSAFLSWAITAPFLASFVSTGSVSIDYPIIGIIFGVAALLMTLYFIAETIQVVYSRFLGSVMK